MTILQMAAAAIFSGTGSALLSVNVLPSSVSGSAFGMGTVETATSDPATANESGGVGPYTFAWTFVSGDSMTINSPTNKTTTFSKTNSVIGSPTFNAVFKCIVTDNNLDTAEDTVSVQLTFTDTT